MIVHGSDALPSCRRIRAIGKEFVAVGGKNAPISALLTLSSQPSSTFKLFTYTSFVILYLNFFLSADEDFLGDSGNIFESTHLNNTGNDDPLEENNEAGVPFGQELNVDELLADTSVMFPILDEESVGDVNDLFGELELLLAVSAFFCFTILSS